ncbi:PrsW family intramembrane metalloprotease [Streptomyces sp. 549]|uniref:PrsW family intramembrane metalloprotease n=1 Tax=Streptomyces sp. 549 TaxID=3049076 RepID=UPI0024C21704|nr:PrsW family intramembrane metalloprotease [Streptomyces sp. 549]MDK1472998.1 PrsW family intramembrane metalloprotease [Streptomyces sp. 549]
MPAERAQWRYAPRRAPWWHRRALRVGAMALLLAVCGLTVLAIVREETGTEGFAIGLLLSVLPVPLLIAAFRWIDSVEPTPWRNLVFAFAWGACAATLVAVVANGFATEWLAASVIAGGDVDTVSATLVAPVVEELAKAAAILLLFLYRRRAFEGVVAGIVIAGITATGFAFTENVLYLGSAYDEDQMLGSSGFASTTAATFFIRIVMSPFAHPLFTAMTGIGFGVAAALPRHRRGLRIALPLLGLLTSMVLHALWNGSASLTGLHFLAVYALFMIPVFATLTWLAVWSRQRDLRTVRATLPAYTAQGWMAEPEPWALGSMRARALARRLARRTHGAAGAQTVSEYHAAATSLALLRARAERGATVADFTAREQELLYHLLTRRDVAGPATASAALAHARPHVPPRWHPYGAPPQHASPPQHAAPPPYAAPRHVPPPAYAPPSPRPAPARYPAPPQGPPPPPPAT